MRLNISNMVDVKLFIDKSVGENASVYYDKSKRLKKKIEGARAALVESRKKLEVLEKSKEAELKAAEKKPKLESKKEWFEKFRWFYSSEGFKKR